MDHTLLFLSDSDLDVLKKTKKRLRSVLNKSRQNILNFLHKKGEATVKEIYVTLRDTQSSVSQHLAILREAKIVKFDRRGKEVYYSICRDGIKNLVDATKISV